MAVCNFIDRVEEYVLTVDLTAPKVDAEDRVKVEAREEKPDANRPLKLRNSMVMAVVFQISTSRAFRILSSIEESRNKRARAFGKQDAWGRGGCV